MKKVKDQMTMLNHVRHAYMKLKNSINIKEMKLIAKKDDR